MTKSIVSFFMAMAFTTTAFAQTTFYVTPSGDTSGAEDRANILQAVEDAKAAGPGNVVELAAGTFYIGGTTFVDDFYGTFTGAGMDVTVLEAIPEIPVDNPFWPIDPNWVHQNVPILLVFGNGDYTISDMTVSLPHFPTSEPWLGNARNAHAMYIVGPNANSVLERVAIEGAEEVTSASGFNTIFGVSINGLRPAPEGPGLWSPLTGTHVVRACRFRNAQSAIAPSHLIDASLIAGGGGGDGNLMENVSQAGGGVWVQDSLIEYSHNKVVGARVAGFTNPVIPGWPTIENSTVVIGHNDIEMAPGANYGIGLTVVDGAEITNNRISGDGAAAISIWDGADCMILGNNVQLFTADVAGVWLNAGTSGCTVVGTPNMVFDEGTDNYITGP